MALDDTINFLESLSQRLQHGALLADQTNDIAVRLIPHIDYLKAVKDNANTIIDVTPTQTSQVVPAPTGFVSPAPASAWPGV
jgi:hypothetical protein